MGNSIKKLKHTMQGNLVKAYKGWWKWHRFVKKYHLGATKVVLLPAVNTTCNYCALLYLDEMLDEQNFENAIILSVDPIAVKAAKLFSTQILDTLVISRKTAEQLMQFYCLFEFDDRFVVASLDEPEGRTAYRLVGKNKTTVDELLAIGIYHISRFEPLEAPAYIGCDPEIKTFLDVSSLR